VLRYDVNQFYEAHHDYFDPTVFPSAKEQADLGIDGGRNNRVATALCYFSEVEEGGETIFPRYDDFGGYVNKTNCDFGFKVWTRMVLLFFFFSHLGQTRKRKDYSIL
jgi:prolyl 4-hydroxylase